MAGGKIDTVQKDGFSFETGPTLVPNTYNELISLLKELGVGNKLKVIEGPMGVIKNGKVSHLRFSNMAGDLLRAKLLSWKSLFSLRHLALPLIKNKQALSFANLGDAAHLDTCSVSEFCDNRVTEEAYTYLLDPAVRATYMHSAKDASLVELLWVLKNLITNTVYYLEGGTAEITKAMQKQLDIECGCSVNEARETSRGVEVSYTNSNGDNTVLSAQHCILAVDPTALQNLLPKWLSDNQKTFLQSYNYGRFIFVSLGLNGPTQEKAYLMQVPSTENPELVGIALDHNRSPRPSDKSVVTAFFIDQWSERMATASDEEIRDAAIEALAPLIPEVKSSVASYHVKHTVPGVSMSKTGDYVKMAAFHQDLDAKSRIQIVGDFFSVSSMNTCVVRAEQVARNIAQFKQ